MRDDVWLDANALCYCSITPEMYNQQKYGVDDCFFMRAEGKGMKKAGILDKDWLFFRRADTAKNGDIVVVEIDGKTLCRRYIEKDDHVYFRRENGRTPDLEPDNYAIRGVLLSLIRNFTENGEAAGLLLH